MRLGPKRVKTGFFRVAERYFCIYFLLATRDVIMKELFAQTLRECLKARYGKLPSAATVARDFNLRAYGTSPITQESARRWMRAESFPKPDHLKILLAWLGVSLDPAVLASSDRLQLGLGPVLKPPDNAADEVIVQLCANLNPVQKKVVVELIQTCFLGQAESSRVT